MVNLELDVRKHVEIALCSDFTNLKDFNELGISTQILPENLQRTDGETFEAWRDRLYHQCRMPVVHAALNDLKLSFVEVINPFLSRRILHEARSLTDNLRTDKYLFKKIVNAVGPSIDYASSSAIGEASYILKYKSAVDLFKVELASENCKSILPERFLTYILTNLKVVHRTLNRMHILKSFLKRFLPKILIDKGSKLLMSNDEGVNRLAFRSFIICKMNKILREDAAVFKKVEI